MLLYIKITAQQYAHFDLRFWTSNSSLQRSTAQEHKVVETTNLVKMLGLVWLIYFTLPPNKTLLSSILQGQNEKYSTSIFDPLDHISPVTTSDKFLQKLWENIKNRIKPQLKTSQELEYCFSWYTSCQRDSFLRKLVSILPSANATLHILADVNLKANGTAKYSSLVWIHSL